MPTNGDPSEVLKRYFTALQQMRLSDAVACFTEDVFYSHPALPEDPPGSPRREAHGHDELMRFFEARGQRKGRQSIVRWGATADGHILASGVVHNPNGELAASFVSELVLSDDGRIRSYAAYSARPAVGTASVRR